MSMTKYFVREIAKTKALKFFSFANTLMDLLFIDFMKHFSHVTQMLSQA